MDYTNHTTNSRKHKHLNYQERVIIQVRLNDGYSPMKQSNWSVDSCFGYPLSNNLFQRSEMVCTKMLYNYIDLQLLEVRNSDLPMKLRRSTKTKHIRTNKRRLGTSIEERPADILT
ncbi:MAG: IS30 family transposase, partial [Cellulosilyticum sp.]|nr:IS30 family transposase [Cellulosilyticum sp.]